MTLPPLIIIAAWAIPLWAAVLVILRRKRARGAADASPREVQSQRLQRTAIIWATVGVTFFLVWLISDAATLRVLSLAAVVAFIVAGAALSGYAAWIKKP
jgi:hypothetical protein